MHLLILLLYIMTKQPTIFISIASYRDPDCLQTVKSLEQRAVYPERLVYGIVEQNEQGNKNEMCVLPNTPIKGTIRRITMLASEARGPQVARYLATTLCKEEDYFFQIDSHCLFVQDWDVKLIEMFNKEQNIRGDSEFIFSHYTSDWSDYDTKKYTPKSSDMAVPRICKAHYQPGIGMFSLNGAERQPKTDRPYPTPFVASGFIFGKTKVIMSVPYDPTLDNLFVGEEWGHSARLYTSGIDVMTPTEEIAFHYYTREGRPHFTDTGKTDASTALEKIRNIAIYGKHDENYGLGNKRSLQDFYNFAGIDLKQKIIKKNFCKINDMEEKENYDYYDKSSAKKDKLLLLFIIIFIISSVIILSSNLL